MLSTLLSWKQPRKDTSTPSLDFGKPLSGAGIWTTALAKVSILGRLDDFPVHP